MNKDGKMDRLEFSIAMKLIKMKLQGQNLPSALPIIMKQPPVPAPTMPLTSLGELPTYPQISLHILKKMYFNFNKFLLIRNRKALFSHLKLSFICSKIYGCIQHDHLSIALKVEPTLLFFFFSPLL